MMGNEKKNNELNDLFEKWTTNFPELKSGFKKDSITDECTYNKR